MRRLDEKEIINFLNNYQGIIAEEVTMSKIDFLLNYNLGDIVDIGIASEIIDLKYYEKTEPSSGLVVYKMKGKVVIESL